MTDPLHSIETIAEILRVSVGTVYRWIREGTLDAEKAAEKATDKPVEKAYEPEREADVHASWADIEAAGRLLGYRPQVDFADGLRRTADYLLAGKD